MKRFRKRTCALRALTRTNLHVTPLRFIFCIFYIVAWIKSVFNLCQSFSTNYLFFFQRSTEQLTRCSTTTLTEETAENINSVPVSRTEKIMSVCRKTLRWIYMVDLVLALSSKSRVLIVFTLKLYFCDLTATPFSEFQYNRQILQFF